MQPVARALLVLVVALAAGAVTLSAAAVATVRAATATVTITLAQAVTVPTESVTLAQVASISGTAQAVRLIGQVVVIAKMPHGARVRLVPAQIHTALAEAGIDLKAVTVSGAETFVQREGAAQASGASSSASSKTPAAPPLVPRGASVKVVAAIGAVRITASGIALAAGAQGQVIPVRIAATRRDIPAVVIERGVVAVQF